MRFFISDTHFGHQNIIKYCNRPFNDVAHMNETLVENWNKVVGSDDTVIHLGDVALGPWVEWDGVLSRLNGTKILVVGNHERIFEGEKEKTRNKFAGVYEKWFDSIIDHGTTAVLANGQEVALSHFPYDGDHMDEARYMEYRLPDEGMPLIHGHTHLDQIWSKSQNGTVQIHVGADAHDYTPVSEQQVIDYLRVADDMLK